MRSALYTGHLVHVRRTPVEHRFRYPVRFFVFDLAELPLLSRRLRLLSHNRPGILSVHDADYGEGVDLESEVRASLLARGVDLEGGRILLCTQARVLGYVFNPVSFFHCYDAGDRLRCVIAEINNTWGERHRYYLGDAERAPDAMAGATFEHDKSFRVSPFIGLEARYRFEFPEERPAETSGAPYEVRMHVTSEDRKPFFFARLTGTRQPLTDATLAWSLVRYPLMTLQIISFIHLEALRLAWKGVPNVRPAPPGPLARPAPLARDPPRALGLAGGEPRRPLP